MVRQHEPKETPRELVARADLQETPREPAGQADLPEEQEEPTKGAAVAGLRVVVEELVTEVKKLVTRSDSSEDGGDEDLGGGGLDAVEHLVRRSPHLLQRLRERLRAVVALGVELPKNPIENPFKRYFEYKPHTKKLFSAQNFAGDLAKICGV